VSRRWGAMLFMAGMSTAAWGQPSQVSCTPDEEKAIANYFQCYVGVLMGGCTTQQLTPLEVALGGISQRCEAAVLSNIGAPPLPAKLPSSPCTAAEVWTVGAFQYCMSSFLVGGTCTAGQFVITGQRMKRLSLACQTYVIEQAAPKPKPPPPLPPVPYN